MESAYPPENACFAAISSTDFDDNQQDGFAYGYFTPAGKQYKWVLLKSGSASSAKRTRGPLVPPGTLIYVIKNNKSSTDAEVQRITKEVMPVGIAVDGIQMPFITASVQVSGVGCVRTGGITLTKVTKNAHENVGASRTDFLRIAENYAGRAYDQAVGPNVQNLVQNWGPIIPSAGEVVRKEHNGHRSWARVSIESMRLWAIETPSKPPFEKYSGSGYEFEVVGSNLKIDSSLGSAAGWKNTDI